MTGFMKIDAHSRSVRQLLSGVKYSIDYYQREYRWQTKQIEELLNDLADKFLDSYDESHEREQGVRYPHYFLGSIILSHKNGQQYIVDGQQRLTSLTLLLIYLNNLQLTQQRGDVVKFEDLIFSESRGQKSFNLQVPERVQAMEALYNRNPFDPTNQTESVQNILARYQDIENLFPDVLEGRALPFFIDWLTENVDLVEIVAYSDEEAYTVFETMNDRGLSLSPTDMLKGYLLSQIYDESDKRQVNDQWKRRILELVEMGRDLDTKNEEIEACKVWIRAKYANTIRERKRGAVNQDFERIGTAFHRWVREESEAIGLHHSADFRDFITQNFEKYTRYYGMMRWASQKFDPAFEYIYYNAYNEFTLQYILALAPIRMEDDIETVERKIRLVTGYIDIFTARRMVNFRTLSYSSIIYTMFNLLKEIRDLDIYDLAAALRQKVDEMEDTFEGMSSFALHQQNRWRVHYILARMTHHIERECGMESSFETYVSRKIQKPFEVEHIWANKYERHSHEFGSPLDFTSYRNHIGGLLLLPRGFNQSLNDAPYEEKLPHYYAQNLLARSLNTQCYQRNPNFRAYLGRSGIPFQPHEHFTREDLDTRQELYRHICEQIWHPDRFERELA